MGVGSGSDLGRSHGRLNTNDSPLAGEKERDGKAHLSQISKFIAYKFCFP